MNREPGLPDRDCKAREGMPNCFRMQISNRGMFGMNHAPYSGESPKKEKLDATLDPCINIPRSTALVSVGERLWKGDSECS